MKLPDKLKSHGNVNKGLSNEWICNRVEGLLPIGYTVYFFLNYQCNFFACDALEFQSVKLHALKKENMYFICGKFARAPGDSSMTMDNLLFA